MKTESITFNRVVRKLLKESGLFSILWHFNSLRKFLWKKLAQNGEFSFHKTKGKEFRLSKDFEENTKLFFKNNNYNSNDYSGKDILDIGAGSRLRATYFNESNIYVIEPLAKKYLKLEQSNLNIAKKIYSTPAEDYIKEFNEKFSFIMCINVLDHCFDEQKVLCNIYSYLTIDGELLLSVDLHEKHKDPMHPIPIIKNELLMTLKNIGFLIKSEKISSQEFTHDSTITLKLLKSKQ